MDVMVNGKRFGSDRAHREAAYCLPLVTSHLERLQAQGIDPGLPLELRGHDEALASHDRALAEAQKRQEKTTDAMDALLASGVDLAAKAWTFAVKAFKTTDAAALESFPSRSAMHAGVDGMVSGLNAVAGFIATHEAAMAQAGTPPGLAQEAARRAEEILEANRVQEAARSVTDARASAVYLARGEIHELCGLVYLAGRAEFRRSPELREKFAYQYMKRDASSGSSAASSSVTGSNASDTGIDAATGTAGATAAR